MILPNGLGMKMKGKTIVYIISLLLIGTHLYAQTPQTLNYQGVLNDNSGNAVSDGSYSITFKIYDVLTAGTALWTETQSVTTKTGVFSAILGASTPINIEFDKQLYLGITVGGSELSPRTTLVSAPYSSNLPKVAFVKDEKVSGSQGGTFTSGAWRTRDLNTLTGNTDFISLSSNQITLEAGTYIIEGRAPSFRVDHNKTRLRNITDGSTEIVGTTARTENGVGTGNDESFSFIEGIITITSQKIFELQHQCATTNNTIGFGSASGFSEIETYTTIKITKISN